MTLHRYHLSSVLAVALLATASLTGSAQAGQEPTVIELTQTGCQFLESEKGIDHGFKTTKKADCEAINSNNGAQRLVESKTINLKPGKYTSGRLAWKSAPRA